MFEPTGERLVKQHQYPDAALWYEQHGDFINAASCWRSANNEEKAIECTYKAGKFCEALQSCADLERFGQWATIYSLWLSQGQSYVNYWSGPRNAAWQLVHGMNYLAVRAPSGIARSFAKEHWPLLMRFAGETGGKTFCDLFERASDADPDPKYVHARIPLARLIELFKIDPFVDELISPLTSHLVQCPHPDGIFGLAQSLHRVWPLPRHAIRIYEIAIEKQTLMPNFVAPDGKGGWWSAGLHWPYMERFWMERYTEACLQAGDAKRAIDACQSRQWYAEAASIMAQAGRLEEALALMKAAGAANYFTVGPESLYSEPEHRDSLWQQKVQELEGKVAAAQLLRRAGNPSGAA